MKIKITSDYFKAELESVGKEGPPWVCHPTIQYMTTWSFKKILQRCLKFKWNIELIP